VKIPSATPISRRAFLSAAFVSLALLSALAIMAPRVSAIPEAKIRGVVIDKSPPGLIGAAWWDVRIQQIIRDDSGSLSVGSVVRVGLVMSPPFPTDESWRKVHVGNKVEVYGQIDPYAIFLIMLNGENYYIARLKFSIITIAVSPASVKLGRATRIHGRISPRHVGAEVQVYMSTDGGATWTLLTTLTTNSQVFYLYGYTAPAKGIYLFKATWQGDADHGGAESRVARLRVR
jgi:hypothetical protein